MSTTAVTKAETVAADEEAALASAVTETAKEVADEAAATLDETGKVDGAKKKKKVATKRIRRVGKTTPRKVPKLEDSTTAEGNGEVGAAVAAAAAGLPDGIPRVLSKHDEKWNAMFEKLVKYKNDHNSTLVPQCFDQDPRLGRWVHYQRVEYWIYQQSANAKITPERIARLEAIGFEWDPQRAQWNNMFKKLEQFKEEVGHCKVPKGYTKDPELANWVRNQRLEHANMSKGKKSRMTQDRYKRLDDMGFKWSTTMTSKGTPKASDAATSTAEEKAEPKEELKENGDVPPNEAPAAQVEV